MTAPMQPVPAPVAPAPAPAAPAPQQAQAPAPDQETPMPDNSPPGGGESATDAAAGDPMAWLTAAELDARYDIVQRPLNGQVG